MQGLEDPKIEHWALEIVVGDGGMERGLGLGRGRELKGNLGLASTPSYVSLQRTWWYVTPIHV